MATLARFPTGYERALTPAAQIEVRTRRQRLVETAGGRVLDLGGAESHAGLYRRLPAGQVDDVLLLDHTAFGDQRLRRRAAEQPVPVTVRRASVGELVDEGAHFDTIVSVFGLAALDNVDAGLGDLRRLLAAGGRLLFLEPVRHPGWTGVLQRAVDPWMRVSLGWSVHRDVPAALRRASFTITDIERFTMPTLFWHLRTCAQGTARLKRREATT
jgi:SAM-dependent methyltransferase